MVLWLEMLVFRNVNLLQAVGFPHLLLYKLNNEIAQLIIVRLVFIVVVALTVFDLPYDSVKLVILGVNHVAGAFNCSLFVPQRLSLVFFRLVFCFLLNLDFFCLVCLVLILVFRDHMNVFWLLIVLRRLANQLLLWILLGVF